MAAIPTATSMSRSDLPEALRPAPANREGLEAAFLFFRWRCRTTRG
jgi:hypothetical protein